MDNHQSLKNPTIFAASIIFVIMLGFIDWVSGYELQFFVFYFIPISVVAWRCTSLQAYFIALLSAGAWLTSDLFSGTPYSHPIYELWNTCIRLLSFLILGYAIARIKFLLEEERKISDNLQKAISEVKTLTGLLPICASCKKIRNDNGYWQRIEEYIVNHSDAQFTHGICQECANKMLREAGIKEKFHDPPILNKSAADTNA
jgi:hypothetical protein